MRCSNACSLAHHSWRHPCEDCFALKAAVIETLVRPATDRAPACATPRESAASYVMVLIHARHCCVALQYICCRGHWPVSLMHRAATTARIMASAAEGLQRFPPRSGHLTPCSRLHRAAARSRVPRMPITHIQRHAALDNAHVLTHHTLLRSNFASSPMTGTRRIWPAMTRTEASACTSAHPQLLAASSQATPPPRPLLPIDQH